MEKPREIFPADEEATVVVAGEEQTLVAPRFDDEETLVARPVVPLGAAEPTAPTAPPAPAYTRARRFPRGPLPLALVLVSVLIGGVLGGAGLYLYQRQSGDVPTTDAPAAATSQTETLNGTPNEAPQPSLTPEALSPTPEPQPSDAATNAPSAEEPAPADEGRAGSDDTNATPAREPESVPAAGTRKRGKKGEHDEEVRRSARRANGTDSGTPLSRADSNDREARRVDTIFYRQRRATRERARRQSDGDVDRLRRIFEGTPE